MFPSRHLHLASRLIPAAALLCAATVPMQAATTPCLVQTAYANTVQLIPSTAPNLTWSWSSAAPTTLRSAGCAEITANLWSTPSAHGTVTMALAPALQTSVALTQITGTTGIVGYPELIYGYKPFGPLTTSQSPAMLFPIALNKLPNVWLMTDYKMSVSDSNLPSNLAYDLWITQAYKGTGVKKGDIELMIWLYRNDDQPAGKLQPLETFTTPLWVNGTLQNGTFDVYAADPTLPNHTSELVTFVLRGAAGQGAGVVSGGYSGGVVGFNLLPFFTQVQRTLSAAYGWSAGTVNAEYLNGIEFGTEFTPDKQQANFSWVLNHMCMVMPKTTAVPVQANASSFVCP
jgi:hypothetical protein